jgi:hypothetical protein
MCREDSLRLSSFSDLPVVQLEFHAERVPWVLDESESE